MFSSHSFWTSSSLDVPAGVTQEEGHTGFFTVRALIFLARRIQPIPSPRRPRSRILCTNDLIVLHSLGIFIFLQYRSSIKRTLLHSNTNINTYFEVCCSTTYTSVYTTVCLSLSRPKKDRMKESITINSYTMHGDDNCSSTDCTLYIYRLYQKWPPNQPVTVRGVGLCGRSKMILWPWETPIVLVLINGHWYLYTCFYSINKIVHERHR